jgi:Dyp-type peroxidase family
LRTPATENEKLGGCDGPNNDFDYANNRPSSDAFAAAVRDPSGNVCPAAAHIRKVNPRALGTDQGGRNATLVRRISRRGIPYGPPLPIGATADPANTDRGLLFLSYQASISHQFEFLQATWTNTDGEPTPLLAPHSGFDMVMGQNPISPRTRFCVLKNAERISTDNQLDREWVIPTGGGYCFCPSRRCGPGPRSGS